jgi:drug/metabolite transporter (DMT)-like permease
VKQNGTQIELIGLISTDPYNHAHQFDQLNQCPIMQKSSRASVWAALGAVYLIWGSTYLGISVVVETMPPFASASIRFLIAGSVLYLLRRLRGDPTPSRIEWRSAAIVGLLLLAGGNGAVVWAEQSVPSGLVALMIGTTPLWIVLLDYLRPWRLFGIETQFARPRPLALLGVVIGFFGVAFLVLGGNPVEGQIDPIGAGVVIFGTISWASGSVYGRSAKLPASPLLGTGMEMLIGGVGLGVLATLAGDWSRLDFSAVTRQSWLALLYLIVVGSWIGFSAYVWLLKNASLPLVSTYAYVNPVVALFLGALILDEPITPRILVAAAIIVGAVVLTVRARTPVAQKGVTDESAA